MSSQQKYWFPAKRYGWGWGIPSTRQGLAVVVAYFALMAGGSFFLSFFLPQLGVAFLVGYIIVVSLLLVAVCRLKGEPLRWHWGSK